MSEPTNDVRERMQETAHMVAGTLPPGTGFIVFAFDMGSGGRCEYIANARREDCVRLLREWISKTEQSFGKHIDPHNLNPIGCCPTCGKEWS